MAYEKIFGTVDQWGYLAQDLDAAMAWWLETLGLGPWWGFKNVAVPLEFEGQQHTVEMDVGMAWQNGVQIEIVQQRNDAPSPYQAFNQSGQAQMMHQIGYFATDIDAAVAKARAAGFSDYAIFNPGASPSYYMRSPMLGEMVLELTTTDENTLAYYKSCADEAESWDGKEPYRLVSL